MAELRAENRAQLTKHGHGHARQQAVGQALPSYR